MTALQRPGACEVGHIRHLVWWNSAVADLATMPLGHIALRTGPGQLSQVLVFDESEDEP